MSNSQFQFPIPNSNSQFPNSNSQFQFPIPKSNSQFQFPIPNPNSNSQFPIPIPNSNSQFPFAIPNSNSKLTFQNYSIFFTFILGGQFLLPQRANNGKREFFQLQNRMRQGVFSDWGIQTGSFAAH